MNQFEKGMKQFRKYKKKQNKKKRRQLNWAGPEPNGPVNQPSEHPHSPFLFSRCQAWPACHIRLPQLSPFFSSLEPARTPPLASLFF
jgi:hypothetical protein